MDISTSPSNAPGGDPEKKAGTDDITVARDVPDVEVSKLDIKDENGMPLRSENYNVSLERNCLA